MHLHIMPVRNHCIGLRPEHEGEPRQSNNPKTEAMELELKRWELELLEFGRLVVGLKSVAE